MRLMGQVGSFSKVSFSQERGIGVETVEFGERVHEKLFS